MSLELKLIQSYFNYFNFILLVVAWFIPLVLIFVISVEIIFILRKRIKQKREMQEARKVKKHHTINRSDGSAMHTTTAGSPRSKTLIRNWFRKCFHHQLSASTKFIIIITTYWIQWFSPCLLVIINIVCNSCINTDIVSNIYWLTYTVCMVDPIVVLLLNPNVSCMRT